MAVRELRLAPGAVEQAWSAAVRVQTKVELALQDLGQEALQKAITSGEATVLLARCRLALARSDPSAGEFANSAVELTQRSALGQFLPEALRSIGFLKTVPRVFITTL